MAKTTTESESPVVQVDDIHLDDFLSSKEASGSGIESLSAFARQQRKLNAFKRQYADYEKAYRDFMNSIPN